MEKRRFSWMLSTEELERGRGLSKSLEGIGSIGISNADGVEDPVLNNMIHGWVDSDSSNNVDHLFGVSDIQNWVSDKTFFVRDSHGENYSISLDSENMIFEIKADRSFRNELDSWNNHITSCIGNSLCSEINMDSSIWNESVNSIGSESFGIQTRTNGSDPDRIGEEEEEEKDRIGEEEEEEKDRIVEEDEEEDEEEEEWMDEMDEEELKRLVAEEFDRQIEEEIHRQIEEELDRLVEEALYRRVQEEQDRRIKKALDRRNEEALDRRLYRRYEEEEEEEEWMDEEEEEEEEWMDEEEEEEEEFMDEEEEEEKDRIGEEEEEEKDRIGEEEEEDIEIYIEEDEEDEEEEEFMDEEDEEDEEEQDGLVKELIEEEDEEDEEDLFTRLVKRRLSELLVEEEKDRIGEEDEEEKDRIGEEEEEEEEWMDEEEKEEKDRIVEEDEEEEEEKDRIGEEEEEDGPPNMKKYKHLWVLCENEDCYQLNYKRFFGLKVCEHCEYHMKMNSSERRELLIDPGTWDAMDEGMASVDPIEFHSEEDPYKDRIVFYQKKTGLIEAVQTGVGQLNGIPIAIGIMEFEFLGGSMGSVVGEKITRLIEYATNGSLPLIIVCASGGARMHEGSLSLMQMAKISSALYNYQLKKKLFYVPILTSPTTGGVTASFGMLGDIIIAEPNATIAFAGKRVIEETLHVEVPEGSQETELLFEKGLFDPVVPRNPLKGVLSELFQLHGFFPLNFGSREIQ
uniref:Acetyl-coenzyme A carboxylase carboxyl transferase subunit beta, chloroplastic n=1 Tax=Isopyrum manshuricum TaxID=432642 RepID=A0A481Y354_9MAGN|nr:acetyl-CoA carboxylase carboxyltransferase beta subunit [Isopyrum manshuricum]QBK50200.1 acetyl-CoA carboxylase carboxyltransferase beta subunit [Isopyrum manshuricum]